MALYETFTKAENVTQLIDLALTAGKEATGIILEIQRVRDLSLAIAKVSDGNPWFCVFVPVAFLWFWRDVVGNRNVDENVQSIKIQFR